MLYEKLHIREEIEKYRMIGIGLYHFLKHPCRKGMVLTIGTRPGRTFLASREQVLSADVQKIGDVKLAILNISDLKVLTPEDTKVMEQEEREFYFSILSKFKRGGEKNVQ